MFYQLRRLWQLGRELIEQFVAELARQLEERERRAHLAEHNRTQFARRQELEARLNAAQTAVWEAQQQLRTIECSVRAGSRDSGTTSSAVQVDAAQRDAARVAVGVAELALDAARAVDRRRSSRSRSRSSPGFRSRRGAPSI